MRPQRVARERETPISSPPNDARNVEINTIQETGKEKERVGNDGGTKGNVGQSSANVNMTVPARDVEINTVQETGIE
jgi:hypothetical protein